MLVALMIRTVISEFPKVNVALLNMGELDVHSQATNSSSNVKSATDEAAWDAEQKKPPNPIKSAKPLHPVISAESPPPGSYSCDVGSEHPILPVVPTFIIIGASKSGTTALYKLLEKIPGMMPANKFEPHFFDKQYDRYIHNMPPYKDNVSYNNITNEQKRQLARPVTQLEEEQQLQNSTKICEFRKKYFDDNFNNEKTPVTPQTITFEKTPSLITYPYVPKFINAICPHKPKIILTLRDPVERAYSEYKMDWQRTGKWKLKANHPESKSFDQIVKTEVRNLVQWGFIKAPYLWYGNNKTRQTEDYWSTLPESSFEIVQKKKWKRLSTHTTPIYRGLYARQLEPWLEMFPLHTHLKVIRHEEFVENPSRMLQDILDFVGFSDHHNLTEEELREDLSPTQKINKHTGLPWVHAPFHNATRAYLKRVYSIFNAELEPLLGPEWKGVWD